MQRTGRLPPDGQEKGLQETLQNSQRQVRTGENRGPVKDPRHRGNHPQTRPRRQQKVQTHDGHRPQTLQCNLLI